jgi:hypothetical protein
MDEYKMTKEANMSQISRCQNGTEQNFTATLMYGNYYELQQRKFQF